MYRDPEQPSIFARPEDPAAEPRTPLTDRSPTTNPLVGRAEPTPAAPPNAFEPIARNRRRLGRTTIALGVGGIVMLALAGFVGASLLAGQGEDPSLAAGSGAPSSGASPGSADASPNASPTTSAPAAPSASPRATAVPTPAPTPVGPPQQLTVGGWATVTVDELNIRRDAGMANSSLYRLVRGAVAHVFEGPLRRDDLDWYRVASLGGAQGWAASGPAADPFLTTFAADTDLLYCDEVTSDVLASTDGSVRARDPIMVGELALPADAFGAMELAVLELLRGTGNEACFSAEIGPAGVPVMYTQSEVGACGRITADGDIFTIRPVAGSPHSVESQVKATTVLYGGLFAAHANIEARIRLAASSADTMPCIWAGVTETAAGYDVHASVDARQCVIVDSHELDHITIRDVDATAGQRFSILPEQPIDQGTLGLGAPVELTISASIYNSSPGFWIWFDEDPACQ